MEPPRREGGNLNRENHWAQILMGVGEMGRVADGSNLFLEGLKIIFFHIETSLKFWILVVILHGFIKILKAYNPWWIHILSPYSWLLHYKKVVGSISAYLINFIF